MTYEEFHNLLRGLLTKREIAVIQECAFQNYEDAHNHRPKRKEQKQMAYSFIIDFLRNMDITECVRYLKPIGIPLLVAIRLWEGLE